jgi:hypothetical protein
VTDWQDIIRRAAYARYSRTADAHSPFLLARGDLYELMRQAADWTVQDFNRMAATEGILRVQVRVYVPELGLQIMVDEWLRP